MRPTALVAASAAALALAGCGDAQPLPPPAATGTVVVNIWEPGLDRPTIIVADRVAQQGLAFDRLTLQQVRSRAVQKDADLAITAPSGTLATRTGTLTLDGPVHFAGTWQSHPVLGIGSSAGLSRDGGSIAIANAEIWNQGERIRGPRLDLYRDHTIGAPQGMDTDPLPAEQAAALAALPDPLLLPR